MGLRNFPVASQTWYGAAWCRDGLRQTPIDYVGLAAFAPTVSYREHLGGNKSLLHSQPSTFSQFFQYVCVIQLIQTNWIN